MLLSRWSELTACFSSPFYSFFYVLFSNSSAKKGLKVSFLLLCRAFSSFLCVFDESHKPSLKLLKSISAFLTAFAIFLINLIYLRISDFYMFIEGFFLGKYTYICSKNIQGYVFAIFICITKSKIWWSESSILNSLIQMPFKFDLMTRL